MRKVISTRWFCIAVSPASINLRGPPEGFRALL